MYIEYMLKYEYFGNIDMLLIRKNKIDLCRDFYY